MPDQLFPHVLSLVIAFTTQFIIQIKHSLQTQFPYTLKQYQSQTTAKRLPHHNLSQLVFNCLRWLAWKSASKAASDKWGNCSVLPQAPTALCMNFHLAMKNNNTNPPSSASGVVISCPSGGVMAALPVMPLGGGGVCLMSSVRFLTFRILGH